MLCVIADKAVWMVRDGSNRLGGHGGYNMYCSVVLHTHVSISDLTVSCDSVWSCCNSADSIFTAGIVGSMSKVTN